MDTDSRRLELLKLEGLGFSQAEVVKELSVKCACSERTVYSDLETDSQQAHGQGRRGNTKINDEIQDSLSRKRITVSLQYTLSKNV